MSNCCCNIVAIEGPEADLLSLRNHINAVCSLPLNTGYSHLALLLLRLGYSKDDLKDLALAEDFTGGKAVIENGILTLSDESANTFKGDGWEKVHAKYSKCSIYFCAEEFGCDIFETNDTSGHIFGSKYCLDWADDEAGSGEVEYFDDDNALIEYVRANFDPSVNTLEQAKAALDVFEEDDTSDRFASLHEIEYNTEYKLLA